MPVSRSTDATKISPFRTNKTAWRFDFAVTPWHSIGAGNAQSEVYPVKSWRWRVGFGRAAIDYFACGVDWLISSADRSGYFRSIQRFS